jgi:hypothetical protein
MSKDFEDEKRTADERVVPHEEAIIPDHLALQRGHAREEPGEDNDGATDPALGEQSSQAGVRLLF